MINLNISVPKKRNNPLLKEMRQKINSNCICIVGSAPDYPYGLIDPIREMAEIAKKYKVNFHVDACMGGFLIPFIDKFSYINFDLDGITSISMDTHKYGYSPKGSSVLLFSHLKYKFASTIVSIAELVSTGVL